MEPGHMLGNIADTVNLQRVLSESEYNGMISQMKDLRTPNTQRIVTTIMQDMWRRK